MKKHSFVLIAIVFYLSVISFITGFNEISAQERKRTCATAEVHERLLRTMPSYRMSQESIENNTREYIRRRVMRTEVVKIPVVVHVVHNNSEQNISVEQIKSQIRILNEDFRKLNADVSLVPSAFQPLVADTRIEFELACSDPDGGQTDGIIRKSTDVTGFSHDDAVKFSASGGSDAWPSDKYLNIWVCNLSGGLLGYAQFPGGPENTDGVVITYDAFGDTGTAASPFNKGRTTSHEIGHWLNLRHVWGDDCQPGMDECSKSDFIDDTPNQACPNSGCPTFPKISCDNGPDGDMFMNYMDYVNDACMFMFTKGQLSRMDATLAGPRLALQSSDGLKNCDGPTPPPPVNGVCGRGSAATLACIFSFYGIIWIRRKPVQNK